MNQLTIISIVGARPQFIKAAAVCRAVSEYNKDRKTAEIRHILIHTGQHYDENMSKVFFEELDIPPPDYNLGIGSFSHGKQTGKMLEAIEEVLIEQQPEWTLVYGDTNSTIAGALAAVKLHLPLAHIEGGLRSFNRRMPEEINRVLTDHISNLIFCPTTAAVSNLKREGVTEGVKMVGDVMYDCSLYYGNKVSAIEAGILINYNLSPKSYYLATMHRAENTDSLRRLKNIIRAFNLLSKNDFPVVFPAHPRTLKILQQSDLKLEGSVKLVPPVSYLEMVVLEKNAAVILTDSGGVQKEAYFYSVPCITLGDETEWIETVEIKANFLTGAETDAIIKTAADFKTAKINFKKGIYGSGNTGELILKELMIESSTQ